MIRKIECMDCAEKNSKKAYKSARIILNKEGWVFPVEDEHTTGVQKYVKGDLLFDCCCDCCDAQLIRGTLATASTFYYDNEIHQTWEWEYIEPHVSFNDLLRGIEL